MRVHFLLHSRNGLEVHKPNCAEIAKAKRNFNWNNDWIEDLPDGDVLAEVVKAMNDSYGYDPAVDDYAPWSPNDIRVLPCFKGKK